MIFHNFVCVCVCVCACVRARACLRKRDELFQVVIHIEAASLTRICLSLFLHVPYVIYIKLLEHMKCGVLVSTVYESLV